MTPLRLLAGLLFCLTPAALVAQAPQPMPPAQPPRPMPPMPTNPPPAIDPNAVAATVNGEAILEMAVLRGLDAVPPAKRREARPEVLNFLIDNLLLDQSLKQANLNPTPPEVEARLGEMKAELTKRQMSLEEMLKSLKLTEAELRQHITADLRWERYVASQATDAALKQLFQTSKEMFDESTVQARHILLTPAADDAKTVEATVAALRSFKQHVEAQAAEALKKVPANADALARERARAVAIDEAFAALAKERSACPSKARGGDLGAFPRVGFMVEPFSKAAFALKPFELSDAVKTPFGYHLILAVDRKLGKDVTYDQVKERVRDVFADRLRDNVVAQLRAKAQIAIAPVK